MGSRKSSGKGSKYVTVFGKRKRISAGTVLTAQVLSAGLKVASDAANAPLNASDFIRHYLPTSVDTEWIKETIGTVSHSTATRRLNMRRPGTMTAVSFLTGMFGIDRFMMRQPALGFAKFLTAGGVGVWWLMDTLTMSGRVRARNLEVLNDHYRHAEKQIS